MDITWASVVPTLIGAVVGASATLFGSVWVQRREVVRSARIRMFYELLPEMWDGWDRSAWEAPALLSTTQGLRSTLSGAAQSSPASERSNSSLNYGAALTNS